MVHPAANRVNGLKVRCHVHRYACAQNCGRREAHDEEEYYRLNPPSELGFDFACHRNGAVRGLSTCH